MKLLNKNNLKKLILIFFLLFSLRSYSQGLITNGKMITPDGGISSGLLLGSSNSFLNVPVSSYNQRAKDFFARVTTAGKTLTDAQKLFYNNYLFQRLIDSGLIHATDPTGDSLECFYYFAKSAVGVAVDTVIVHLNLLQDAYNCIGYGTRTYTDSGVVGNGTTGYLNTFFNPYLDSSIYKLNSASLGVYSKTKQLSGLGIDMGCNGILATTSIYLCNQNASSKPYNRINDLTYSTNTYGNIGLWGMIRYNNTGGYYANNTTFTTFTTNSVGLPNRIIFIKASNEGSATYFSTELHSSAFIGSGLSATKSRALSNIINSALAVFNYNVY